ncbi:MAG: 23S ribosomal RNA methyltransferase Erm [Caldilineaceae bacterium]
MAEMPNKQRALGQNFFKSRRLVRGLIAATSINPMDTVYEIGPGEGIITRELAAVAQQVVAIEKDPQLVVTLRRRLQDLDNVTIVEEDFLLHHVRARNYTIFGNIPFNRSAAIMRKLFYTINPPQRAYLVLQSEAARKFAGLPHETQFSLLIKPWFELQIMRKLARTDFHPAPKVNSVFLAVNRRKQPLIAAHETRAYRHFVKYGFRQWQWSLRLSYKAIFTYQQWKRLACDLGFPLEATPTQLSLAQWVGLFGCFQRHVPPKKQVLICHK